MDVTDLVDAVSEETNTELSRLGSSKSLYADTRGELSPEAVLSAMADATYHAAAVFDDWTHEEDTTDVAAGAAERIDDQYDAVAGELDAHEPGDVPAVVAALPRSGDPAERLGALVGWTLVAERKASQATGYFTGQADPTTAGLFREFRDDYEAIRGAALDALETVADDEAALAAGRAAAVAAVEAAYDEYVEHLEAQGVNPKPVC